MKNSRNHLSKWSTGELSDDTGLCIQGQAFVKILKVERCSWIREYQSIIYVKMKKISQGVCEISSSALRWVL